MTNNQSNVFESNPSEGEFRDIEARLFTNLAIYQPGADNDKLTTKSNS